MSKCKHEWRIYHNGTECIKCKCNILQAYHELEAENKRLFEQLEQTFCNDVTGTLPPTENQEIPANGLRLMTIAVEDWDQLRRERDDLKPWAELGKATVEKVDGCVYYHDPDFPERCDCCNFISFCQKRKELEGAYSE